MSHPPPKTHRPHTTPPIAITPQLQQLFLDQASFAAQVGVNMVVSFMRHAVTQVVGTLDLKQAMGMEQLRATVGAVMEVYQGMVGGVGLAAVLLPSPEQMQVCEMWVSGGGGDVHRTPTHPPTKHTGKPCVTATTRDPSRRCILHRRQRGSAHG